MSVVIGAGTAKISRTANLPVQTALTVAGWFKVIARTGNSLELSILYRRAAGPILYYLGFTNTGVLRQNCTGEIDAFASSPGTGVWVYKAITVSGQTAGSMVSWWFDATQTLIETETNASTPQTFTPDALHIAGHPSNDTEWLNCKLAYVRVWDAALNQSELEAEMASTTIVRTSNINTSFDGNDIACPDVSGNARHWTTAGTITLDSDMPIGGPAPTFHLNRSSARLA